MKSLTLPALMCLFAWVPLVLYLFRRLPKHRAVIAAFIFAWLFLPVVDEDHFRILGGIKLNKMRITSCSVLLATLLFDRQTLFSFRARWFDLPMLLWCLCPAASVLTNDPPPPESGYPMWRDLVAGVNEQFLRWGFAYFIGRLYFTSFTAFRDLAVGIVFGGLVYVPLCLFEIKFSPQLHSLVYGAHANEDFSQTMRWGGYRPSVFMSHGLEVGVWMTTASLLGFWLWWPGAVRKLQLRDGGRSVPMFVVVPVLTVTAVLCKSSGALGLAIVGVAVLLQSRVIGWPVLMAVLLAVAPAYMGTRGTKSWDGMDLVRWIKEDMSPERSQSLGFRFQNENLIVAHALKKPLFGWGGWGRALPPNPELGTQPNGQPKRAVPDGLWVLTLGERGLVGLVVWSVLMLLASVRFTWCYPPSRWCEPHLAALACCAVILVLYQIDCLLNAMINPIFMLISGGMMGLIGTSPPVAGSPSEPRRELPGVRQRAVEARPVMARPGVLMRRRPFRT